MQQIQLTKGCPVQCQYCYEPRKMQYFKIPKIKQKEVQILDMNFLSNPNCKQLLEDLPKIKSYEFVCGIDFRRFDQEIADLMKEKKFIKVRWAWDYGYDQQKIHQKTWRMFKKAGYRSESLSVFMITNWKTSYIDCVKKLELLKVWNVKVNDCCFDGGYPKSEIDFNTNKRFHNKRFWKYSDIKKFGITKDGMCRKHNQLVMFKIDPELK